MRLATDHLPEEEMPLFLAFQLARGNVVEWHTIIHTMDRLEVYKAYAMLRTAKYLAEEELNDG